MPRKPRLFVSGATYHVYCRVGRGEFVFDDEVEAAAFVEVVRKVRDLDRWNILAWCLMANHYHLVVQTGKVPLWRSMARLQGRVARGFNQRKRYLGRLWQSRYRARVIDTQDYFRQVVCYVHLNPVAANIVTDPADYPNSGHREIVGQSEPRLVDPAVVLRGFTGRIGAIARRSYLTWMRSVAEARLHTRRVGSLPWWAEARDVDDIAEEEKHPHATTYDGQPLEDHRRRLDLGNFVARFERFSGHSIDDLASPLRSRTLIQARIELTMLAVARYGLRSCDVAKLVGKDRTSLTRWMTLGLRLERTDPAFRDRLDTLDKAISEAERHNASMRNVAP
jgi:putative transposase